MCSKEVEKVDLQKPQKARGQVETWLLNLSDEMKNTVYRRLKEGQKAYTDEGRSKWVLEQPGQVVATVA